MNSTSTRIASLICGLALIFPVDFARAELPIATPNETVDSSAVTVSLKPSSIKKAKAATESNGLEVEMFRAMAEGQLEVDYIAKDATQANLIFRNRTDKPLKIKLPETFGAVHVLAQGMMGGGMGGMGGGMGGMGGGMGGGGGQGMGGGMDAGGMDAGMGGGMFRVDIDKPRKMPVATLCLEHGKLDPTPRMKYKVVPLELVNANPQVAELCKLLGRGKVSQNSAQAAAWHVANGLSWQELLNKPRVISKYTGIEMFFSQFEVQNAMRLVAQVTVQVADHSDSTSSEFSSENDLTSSDEK